MGGSSAVSSAAHEPLIQPGRWSGRTEGPALASKMADSCLNCSRQLCLARPRAAVCWGYPGASLSSRVASSECPCGSAWAWCHLSWAASAHPVYKTGTSRIPTSRLRSYRGASLRRLSSKSVAFWKVYGCGGRKRIGGCRVRGWGGWKGSTLLPVMSLHVCPNPQDTQHQGPSCTRGTLVVVTCQCRPPAVTRAPSVGTLIARRLGVCGGCWGGGNSASFSPFCSELQTALKNEVY